MDWSGWRVFEVRLAKKALPEEGGDGLNLLLLLLLDVLDVLAVVPSCVAVAAAVLLGVFESPLPVMPPLLVSSLCCLLATEAAAVVTTPRADVTNDPAIPPMTLHALEPLGAAGAGAGLEAASESAAAILSDAPFWGGGRFTMVGPDDESLSKSGDASIMVEC